MSTVTKPAPFGPDLRAALIAMVRKRVPESEVEDIVQQALAEAIESPHAPEDSESLRRWIFGVAKNKVVDYHRRAGRESFDLPDVEGAPAPHVEADLLRWAERNLPEGAENKKTLDWMLREGEGEKLESIAASEKLPPPRVRQRVSRLRRHFKENWQREVALLAALGVVISAVVLFVLKKDVPEPITHDVDPRAEPVRRLALERCAKGEWQPCVDGLDEARRLDPAGDKRPEVQSARQAAESARERGDRVPEAPPTLDQAPPPLPSATPPSPTPSPTPSSSPSSSIPPPEPTAPVQKLAKPQPTTAPTFVPTPPPPPTGKPTSLSDPSKTDGFQRQSEKLAPEDNAEPAAPSKMAPSKAAPSKKAPTKSGSGGSGEKK